MYMIYGGVKYTKVRNALYCRKCMETIESKWHHDFKMCSCGAIGIDGGIEAGSRILGNLSDMETRSIYCASINGRKLWLPQSVTEKLWLHDATFISSG